MASIQKNRGHKLKLRVNNSYGSSRRNTRKIKKNRPRNKPQTVTKQTIIATLNPCRMPPIKPAAIIPASSPSSLPAVYQECSGEDNFVDSKQSHAPCQIQRIHITTASVNDTQELCFGSAIGVRDTEDYGARLSPSIGFPKHPASLAMVRKPWA